MDLTRQIEEQFGLRDVRYEFLSTPTNDVIKVTTPTARYALKVYNISSRSVTDVQWEVELIHHLRRHGAPVVEPIANGDEYVKTLRVDDTERAAVLFEWLAGEKPQSQADVYVRLGEAAGLIHNAADTFVTHYKRHPYDAARLVDEQLERMRNHLQPTGKWPAMVQLSERLKRFLTDSELDWGVCHMDLTLDNVHESDGRLTVFDFDSSAESWRALEPHGVLRFSEAYFANWLEGYRAVRPFSAQEEHAVTAFCVVGDLRVVAWNLGVAVSSRGEPLLDADGLTDVVDGWLAWGDRL